MPTYRIRLNNGKSLVLRGDTPPSDQDIEQAAEQAGVRELLMPAEGEAPFAVPNPSTAADRSAVSPGAVVGVAMTAAPAAVSLVHRGAGLAGKLAKSRLTPAVVAGSVLNDLGRGDVGQAAKTAAGTAAAAYAVPKVAGAVARATAPAGRVAGGVSSVLQANGTPFQLPATTTPGGVLSRAAGALSRAAGPVGLAIETVLGDGAAGHRPYAETTETAAARQSDWARSFRDTVNQQAGRIVIEGETTEQIVASIIKYRQGQGR